MDWTERIGLTAGSVMYFCLLFVFAPPVPVPGDGAELVYGFLTRTTIHPPGYPLYTALGGALQFVSPVTAPLTGAALSAVFAVLTMAVFYLFLSRRGIGLVSRLLSLGVMATAYPVWELSVKPEVYTLNAFFFMSAVYAWDCVLRSGRGRLILWGIVGLSLTHHPLALLNGFLAVHATWKTLPSFQFREGLALMMPVFLYGTLLMPVSSVPFNWPLIGTPQVLIDHMLGGTFSRFFLAEGFLTPILQLGRIGLAHLVVFPVFVALPAIYGYWCLHRDLTPLVVLQLILVIALSVYGIPDVRDFLVPSYFVGGIALASGLEALRSSGFRHTLTAVICVIVSYPVFFYGIGIPRYDWSHYNFSGTYAAEVDEAVRSGTVLSDWSHYTILRYYQLTGPYLSGVHLLTPTHRFDTWAAIIRFHQKQNQPIYTTLTSWNPPDSMERVQKGPLYRVIPAGQ
ncbi:MAG: protein O-mannosyl-transferase family [bacterium]